MTQEHVPPEGVWPPPTNIDLFGRHVHVSPYKACDAEELFAALDDAHLWTHVKGRPGSVQELSQTLAAAASSNRYPYVVRSIETREIVGTSSVFDGSSVDARCEIGFTTYRRDVWATQVNPETKLLLLRFCFEVLSMNRVQLKTDIRNDRSQSAISRLGAVREGVLRQYQRRSDGTLRDTVLFSITAQEWPAVQRGLRKRLGQG